MAEELATPEAEAADTGATDADVTTTPAAAEAAMARTMREVGDKSVDPAKPGTLADGVADVADGADGADANPADKAPADWPDDWRDRLANGDDKAMKRLARFASPQNLVRTLMEQDRKISSGQYKRALGEGASEAEIAAYRKEHGIPEEATAEAYGIEWPKGFEPSEADQEDVNGFLTEMHGKNMPPEFVKGVWQHYVGMREKAEQQAFDAAQAQTVEWRDELRDEYGREFKTNISLGNAFLSQHLGDKAAELTSLTLANGTKLGDNPEFVRFIVNAGRASSDDEALVVAEMGNSGTLEEQYREAIKLRETDSKKYHSDEHQAKLMRLAQARLKKAG